MTKPAGAVRLHVEPCSLTMANRYVDLIHRHHGMTTPMGQLFSVAAVVEDGRVAGVAVTAFPVAANRLRDGMRTIEVVRLATDGTPNGCSVLYSACARAARDLGFSRIISYILDDETGVSLKASGWHADVGEFGNQSWTNHTKRPGLGSNTGPKQRWSLDLMGMSRPSQVWPLGVAAWNETDGQESLLRAP